MHPQGARGRGDIAVVLHQHTLQVLPFQPVDRHGPGNGTNRCIAVSPLERRKDLVRAGRLGQVMNGPELDGLHRGRDARVPRQDQDPQLGMHANQPFDERKT